MVPAISISIPVDFHVPAIPELCVGRLWDVSQSGACLLFPTKVRSAPGYSGKLTMHHPNIGDAIHAEAELIWVDRLSQAVYTGALFRERINFEQTFLSILVRNSRDTPSRPLINLREDPGHLLDWQE